ncbi:hypothetical protein EV670_1258 [Rivibacter subsaxonicus]|uniref:Uncharacterized protein n=2 Tax=Rivibacter subsaxonicus TaxID=457575 RepID=A0A4Q7VVU0_9BURK|nr:hypothetical protein EV670_1258 [Rivibacter subsaxonicus]
MVPPPMNAILKPTLATDSEAASGGSLAADAWPELAAQIGREVGGPLSAALERVIQLTTTGRIDRGGLRALRAEIERARRAGMVAQQLARYASKRLRQSHERLNLAGTLQSVLAQRSREVGSRGIQVRQSTRPIEVLVDPALLFGLLNALLDWAIECAHASIDFGVDTRSWPAHGCVLCRFTHEPRQEDALADIDAPTLDSLNWHLLRQGAAAMGLLLDREVDGNRVSLALEFPRTVNESIEGVTAIDLEDGFGTSLNSKPLAGSHVLVVAARREMRMAVRSAIADMGLLLDFVGSVDEAIGFCREALPHAIVFEAALRSERLDTLADEIRDEVPGFAFVEVAEEGEAFEVSGFNGQNYARVGRDGLAKSLPSAIVFELSKSF